MAIVGVAKPLVRGEVAGHAPQAGEARDLVEHRAHLLAERATPRAVGRKAAGGHPPTDRLDEGGGDVGIVGLVAIDQTIAAIRLRHHDSRDMVPQVDEPHDLLELAGGPRQKEPAPEEVTRALDPLTGAKQALVAIRRGHDRADEQRAVDARPGEAEGIRHEPSAMDPQVAQGGEPPGQLTAGHPPDGVPFLVGEGTERHDVLGIEEVVKRAAAGAIRAGWGHLHSHEQGVWLRFHGPGDAVAVATATEIVTEGRPAVQRDTKGFGMAGILTRLIGGDLAALTQDACGEFVRRSRQGGVVPLRIGLARGHLVSDPALVRHVLLENIDNYDKHTPAFDAVRVVLGNGMLTSGGEFWRRQRRIAQPAFHGESVRHFAPVISRLASQTADEWERAAAANAPVDACADMMRVTLRIVADTLFGDDLAGDAAAINLVFPVILACLAARVTSPIRPPLWLPTATNRRLRPASRGEPSTLGGDQPLHDAVERCERDHERRPTP
ncbi:MAG: cytochrome P450 [Planctomycetia bacterium]|nr:cytochrome P450 [Planctomycetia bacterium]